MCTDFEEVPLVLKKSESSQGLGVDGTMFDQSS